MTKKRVVKWKNLDIWECERKFVLRFDGDDEKIHEEDFSSLDDELMMTMMEVVSSN